MATRTTQAQLDGLPEEVLGLLTQPEAVRQWAPVPFETRHRYRGATGWKPRVSQGTSAVYAMTFEVEVHEASPHVRTITGSWGRRALTLSSRRVTALSQTRSRHLLTR
jgi:hypothetical protein